MSSASVALQPNSDDLATPAEKVIAAQLKAYNDRDLEQFVSHWAPDAKIYSWPDGLVAEGLDEIAQAHAERFAQPHLHAVLLSRLAIDDLVIDRELVTRTEHDQPKVVQVIAIYEIKGGLIQRAWFKQVAA